MVIGRLLLTRRIARSLGDSGASCFTFLVPAYPGCPENEAVKRLVCLFGHVQTDPVRQRHSDLSQFQWYQSSSFSSSTSTDEQSSPGFSDDDYTYQQQLDKIRAARRASVPCIADTVPLLLRASSDTPSVVSVTALFSIHVDECNNKSTK